MNTDTIADCMAAELRQRALPRRGPAGSPAPASRPMQADLIALRKTYYDGERKQAVDEAHAAHRRARDLAPALDAATVEAQVKAISAMKSAMPTSSAASCAPAAPATASSSTTAKPCTSAAKARCSPNRFRRRQSEFGCCLSSTWLV